MTSNLDGSQLFTIEINDDKPSQLTTHNSLLTIDDRPSLLPVRHAGVVE